MLFPIIRIREKGDKDKGRIVGTNSHDLLKLDEDGNIKYVNLQCMEGTGKHSCFEFVAKKEMFTEEIQLVSFEELIKIYMEETKELCESEKALINLAKKFREEQIKENGLDKDEGFSNSAGHLI